MYSSKRFITECLIFSLLGLSLMAICFFAVPSDYFRFISVGLGAPLMLIVQYSYSTRTKVQDLIDSEGLSSSERYKLQARVKTKVRRLDQIIIRQVIISVVVLILFLSYSALPLLAAYIVLF
jgi:hypothetical protein